MKLQEKTLLFGHYLFNLVKAGDTTFPMMAIDGNTGCVSGPVGYVSKTIEECKLVLRPITSITNKDAIQCARFSNLPESLFINWQLSLKFNEPVFCFPGDEDAADHRRIVFSENKLNYQQIDFLRSQGYAIGVRKEWLIIENPKPELIPEKIVTLEEDE